MVYVFDTSSGILHIYFLGLFTAFREGEIHPALCYVKTGKCSHRMLFRFLQASLHFMQQSKEMPNIRTGSLCAEAEMGM